MLKFSDEVFEAMQRLLRAQRELSQTMLGGGNGLLAERTEDVAGGGGDRSQPGGAEQQDESSDVTGAAGIDEDVALQEPGQDVMGPDEIRNGAGRPRGVAPGELVADVGGSARRVLIPQGRTTAHAVAAAGPGQLARRFRGWRAEAASRTS